MIKIMFQEWSREISLCVEFSDRCEISMALAKVALQVVMWLLKN